MIKIAIKQRPKYLYVSGKYLPVSGFHRIIMTSKTKNVHKVAYHFLLTIIFAQMPNAEQSICVCPESVGLVNWMI